MEEKEIIKEDQEIKEQQPTEEAPVEEEKKVDETDSSILIEKPTAETRPYGEVVEESRKTITTASKKSSRLSTLSIIVVLAFSITGLFLLNVQQIVAFVLMGCSVVTLIVFSIIIRRVARPDVKGYIVTASSAINQYVFSDTRFSEVKYDPSDKIELKDVANDGAYLNVKRVASRNVVEGLYEDRSFKVCEAAFFRQGQGKKDEAIFIGKYLTLPNNLHFEGRIILIKKGPVDTDLPDALEDLVKIEGDELFYAYGPNENSLKELDKKFIKAIKEFDVSAHLMNLTVVVWAGKTIIYASYDDATITLPFYEKYQEDTAVQYRNNLVALLEASHLLLKE